MPSPLFSVSLFPKNKMERKEGKKRGPRRRERIKERKGGREKEADSHLSGSRERALLDSPVRPHVGAQISREEKKGGVLTTVPARTEAPPHSTGPGK